ncbi:MAG TPA: hypothetical protein DG753_08810 [Clostridium sp.]|nr:hypothetical protein [Clostridium sp.]
MDKLEKCINKKYDCYCNKLRECKECDGNHILDGKCELGTADFCTCRRCGNAVRSDGYKYSEESN